jgi:hypothetical protein
MDRQAVHLTELLATIPRVEAEEFETHFVTFLYRAYRWDLWRAAFLIAGGCSDDGFMDFRLWLISMGRSAYENALRDPDSLAEVVSDESIEAFFFEGFGPEPIEGLELPEHPSRPVGTRFTYSDDEFRRHLPRLWELYGTTRR